MKILLIIVFTALLFSCDFSNKQDKPINGIMIDCSRLLEKQEYYYKLIDFMADWDMNTLLLHFSDDHGCAIRIPGFEKLAKPHAFTPQDIKHLVSYAKKRGIDIIPELEVFGHTRYITDHPDYQHLYFGDKPGNISFNAIDPLNSETLSLMASMIKKVAAMFPSEYFHLGCDEVNLQGLEDATRLDEARVWADYVNKMIYLVKNNGKTPMIWSDHLQKDANIARMLDKEIVLVEWNYSPDYKPTKLPALAEMGFADIIMAPSISCYLLRVLPSKPGLTNTDAMAVSVRDKTAMGLINTVWLPMRYLQNAMWYGIAYSAYLINSGESMDPHAFHEAFAQKVFKTPLTQDLDRYLTSWIDLYLDRSFYISMARGQFDFSADPVKMGSLRNIYDLSKELLDNPPDYMPKQNADILESMFLATRVMKVVSEGLLIHSDPSISAESKNDWKLQLNDVINAVDKEWDVGRYPDDPDKYKAKFPNQENSYLLILLKKLEGLSK